MSVANLILSLEELSAKTLDVIIIGSGPAGVAVAERLYEQHPDATIGVLERGTILTLTHINNIFSNEKRRTLIDRFKSNLWDGTFQEGGMLITALGGRGTVSGALLRRFDEIDFTLWKNGQWPASVVADLPHYYNAAELQRRVSVGTLRGPAQTWAIGTLHEFQAYPPPLGIDLWPGGGFEVGKGYDSSASRLWKLLLDDSLTGKQNRIHVATNAYVTRIVHNGSEVTGLWCLNTLNESKSECFLLKARQFVLAASPIESSRLVLHSQLGSDNPAVGRYLAEHLERRAKIIVPAPTRNIQSQGISVLIPPAGTKNNLRFQIHLRGEPDYDGNLIIDIAGFAAMDPSSENCVTLSLTRDVYDVPRAHTHVLLTDGDKERAGNLCHRIQEIGKMLNGKFITERYPYEGIEPKYVDHAKTIQLMDPGRSYHEAGTLRMGIDASTSVTDEFGKFRGVANFYAADASVSPCVGVANPMLTITALGYRLADYIHKFL